MGNLLAGETLSPGRPEEQPRSRGDRRILLDITGTARIKLSHYPEFVNNFLMSVKHHPPKGLPIAKPPSFPILPNDFRKSGVLKRP